MSFEAASEKTVAVPAGGEATVMGASVSCPVCDTQNAPTEKYCGECGFLLSSTPVENAEGFTAPDQMKLVETTGGKEHFLKEGENIVGRESADVLLSVPTVSRRHALVIVEGGRCSVEDLGSTNGTEVGTRKLEAGERVEVSSGDVLRFGSAELALEIPESMLDAEEETGESEEIEGSVEGVEGEPVELPESVDGTEEEQVDEVPAEPEEAGRLASVKDPSIAFPLKSGANTIGRRSGNDVIVDDPYVSGSHAEIAIDETGAYLTDVGSTNGTMLNGEPVSANERMTLNGGDEITVGNTVLRFEPAAGRQDDGETG